MSTQPAAQHAFEPAEALSSATEQHSAASSALREQAAMRLAAHRARHAAPSAPKQSQTHAAPAKGKSAAVAAAVAARYARAQSYRDFLAAEAEEALRRAEAAAEVATRNAEAIAAERQHLLAELDQWNAPVEAANPEASAEAVEEFHLQPLEVASAVLPQIHAHSAEGAESFAVEPEDFFGFEEPVAPTPLPANLIEFPRVLVATRKARPRLAEGPLREEADEAVAQLRIFEVEAVSTTPAPTTSLPEWSSIRLDAAVRPETAEQPESSIPAYTIPIQTAAIQPRVHAFLADTGLVALATTAFAGVLAYATHRTGLMPDKKAAAIAIVAVFFLFKLIYQLLFFTLNESTPGMLMARIGVCTFNDDNPTRAELRRRIGATLLAACPMGLGLLWAWFDVDRLGWHDRMTRTYQRSY
ncbi:MAG: RDD family protein [Acidobacteriaceae bacterium]|nr:RDD family protein [Acidobacteriaceae bacterium]